MYYFLRQDLFNESSIIEIAGHTDATAEFSWIDGVRFDRSVPVETLMLDPSYGTNFPDFFDTSIPVMSNRLISALVEYGVSNLDVYPVILKNQRDGSERRDYSAVNLVGVLDPVDLSQSTYRLRYGNPYFTGPVVIDPSRAGELLAFRLLHGPGFIVVVDALAKYLQSIDLTALLLQPTTAYQGT